MSGYAQAVGVGAATGDALVRSRQVRRVVVFFLDDVVEAEKVVWQTYFVLLETVVNYK